MKSTWQIQSTFTKTISSDPLRHRRYYYSCVVEIKIYVYKEVGTFLKPTLQISGRARLGILASLLLDDVLKNSQ
jgi:hypothetical protein